MKLSPAAFALHRSQFVSGTRYSSSLRAIALYSWEMDFAERYRVPMLFQVLPLPLPVAPGPVYSSRLRLGLLGGLKIPYPEYISESAAMEARTEDHFQLSFSASLWSIHDISISDASQAPGQDWQHIGNSYDSLGFVRRHSESYKNLDLDDAIFIPNLCSDDQPVPPPAPGSLQVEMEFSSQVPPQHIKPQSPVVTLQGDVWHLRPQNSDIPASTDTADNSILTPSTTTTESNRSLSISSPYWSTRPSDQASPLRTSPSSHGPQTPPARIPGGSSRTPRRADLIARELMTEQDRLARQSGSGPARTFIPSRLVQERNSPESPRPHALPPTPTNPARNTSHYGRSDVPADQNCAIYVVGIPAEARYADVLSSIRGGKILVCLIDPPNGQHPTAAAKIVFFTRASAELFMRRSSEVGVYVLGRRLRAMWNRIFYAAHAKAHQSRVVLISGPAHLMDFEFFEAFFRARFEFQEESRAEVPCDREGYVRYMWSFASLRAQAELAYIAIEREWGGIFGVEYGPDLCARPWV